ncbi:dGTP triphosphohydrolase [Roseibium sp. RKSG952]|uniref:dGTP triphosphohydrolase n=1 Tax=Roseibium sp. RKSG952 TaxID=2529384 RepID=UPI0012BB5925|nr:dNTP triphosphohydrolase [Roseibium sp. RKSG952]MTI02127.1 dNTP triphosphohydrolase [Roseibium sp. RKSG952]
MEWSTLLSNERLHDPKYSEQVNRSIFTQDYDRIVFSEPFRRLANKTQVQPLYEHDHVHHRLIHSIEVGSVGRSLAMAIGQWLVEHEIIDKGEENSLANIVQAACAAHDIGNPPFGHSGENAIGEWFLEKFTNAKGMFADLDPILQEEFCAFEGNAQGFRIIARTEMYRNDGGMRLSKAVLGAFMKYPLSAATKEGLSDLAYKEDGYFGGKKFGVFNSELPLFEEVAQALNLTKVEVGSNTWWRRHPLVFVVEAADDICYNIVDLEDAFTTGELQFDVVRRALFDLADKPNRDTSDMSEAEQIAYLRAVAIGKGIENCLEAFKANYSAIMAGTFSQSLVEAGKLSKQFEEIKDLSKKRIFTARRKTELEVSGHRIIGNVLSGILPVYEQLATNNWDRKSLDDHSKQVERALLLDLRGISNVEQALHSMADFISGMTDRYALRISRMLSGT